LQQTFIANYKQWFSPDEIVVKRGKIKELLEVMHKLFLDTRLQQVSVKTPVKSSSNNTSPNQEGKDQFEKLSKMSLPSPERKTETRNEHGESQESVELLSAEDFGSKSDPLLSRVGRTVEKALSQFKSLWQ
jgi:hypothetical protein